MDFHDVVTGSADDGGLRGGESYAQQVADAKALAATSLDGALQNLLGFEKTARLSGNVAGTRELVTAMVELCEPRWRPQTGRSLRWCSSHRRTSTRSPIRS